MVAGDGQHAGTEAVSVVEVEVHSHARDPVRHVGIHGRHAGDVEEGGHGAGCLWFGVLAFVAGVVLRSTADNDVVDGKTLGRGRKTIDCLCVDDCQPRPFSIAEFCH